MYLRDFDVPGKRSYLSAKASRYVIQKIAALNFSQNTLNDGQSECYTRAGEMQREVNYGLEQSYQVLSSGTSHEA